MELVGSGTNNGVHYGAAGSAELGVIVRRLNVHFLHSHWNFQPERLARDRDVVVLGTIDQKVIRSCARTIHRKRLGARGVLSLLVHARKNDGKHCWITAEGWE